MIILAISALQEEVHVLQQSVERMCKQQQVMKNVMAKERQSPVAAADVSADELQQDIYHHQQQNSQHEDDNQEPINREVSSPISHSNKKVETVNAMEDQKVLYSTYDIFLTRSILPAIINDRITCLFSFFQQISEPAQDQKVPLLSVYHC